MLFNVFSLVNTWHALGFSVFLMVDTLTSIVTSIRCRDLISIVILFASWSQLLFHVVTSSAFDKMDIGREKLEPVNANLLGLFREEVLTLGSV